LPQTAKVLLRPGGRASRNDRHGPTAKVTLRFEKQFTRFYDLAKEDTLPAQTR
jgi:hypothetical protein